MMNSKQVLGSFGLGIWVCPGLVLIAVAGLVRVRRGAGGWGLGAEWVAGWLQVVSCLLYYI